MVVVVVVTLEIDMAETTTSCRLLRYQMHMYVLEQL